MFRSIITFSSIVTFQMLSLSPVLACDPYLYSGDFEEMLNDGESWEIVLDAMRNSIGYRGQSCFYEFKKYSKKNKSKFPNLYMIMSKQGGYLVKKSYSLHQSFLIEVPICFCREVDFGNKKASPRRGFSVN